MAMEMSVDDLKMITIERIRRDLKTLEGKSLITSESFDAIVALLENSLASSHERKEDTPAVSSSDPNDTQAQAPEGEGDAKASSHKAPPKPKPARPAPPRVASAATPPPPKIEPVTVAGPASTSPEAADGKEEAPVEVAQQPPKPARAKHSADSAVIEAPPRRRKSKDGQQVTETQASNDEATRGTTEKAPVKRARALYVFPAPEDDDLAFAADDEIVIVQVIDNDWCVGELDGRRGLVPTDYIEFILDEVPDGDKPVAVAHADEFDDFDADFNMPTPILSTPAVLAESDADSEVLSTKSSPSDSSADNTDTMVKPKSVALPAKPKAPRPPPPTSVSRSHQTISMSLPDATSDESHVTATTPHRPPAIAKPPRADSSAATHNTAAGTGTIAVAPKANPSGPPARPKPSRPPPSTTSSTKTHHPEASEALAETVAANTSPDALTAERPSPSPSPPPTTTTTTTATKTPTTSTTLDEADHIVVVDPPKPKPARPPPALNKGTPPPRPKPQRPTHTAPIVISAASSSATSLDDTPATAVAPLRPKPQRPTPKFVVDDSLADSAAPTARPKPQRPSTTPVDHCGVSESRTSGPELSSSSPDGHAASVTQRPRPGPPPSKPAALAARPKPPRPSASHGASPAPVPKPARPAAAPVPASGGASSRPRPPRPGAPASLQPPTRSHPSSGQSSPGSRSGRTTPEPVVGTLVASASKHTLPDDGPVAESTMAPPPSVSGTIAGWEGHCRTVIVANVFTKTSTYEVVFEDDSRATLTRVDTVNKLTGKRTRPSTLEEQRIPAPPSLDDDQLQECARLLNPQVVAFCEAHRGQVVGDGECATLAAEALLATPRARPARGYNWGQEIAAELVVAGDIIQFEDCSFEHHERGVHSFANAPHHTAVAISSVDNNNNGAIHVLECNTNGDRSVHAGVYHLQDRVKGTLQFFRPLFDRK